MMGHREKMDCGDEHDAFTRWKRYVHWKPGERKRIKKKASRRARQSAKREVEE